MMIDREFLIDALDRLGQIIAKLARDEDFSGFDLGITATEYQNIQQIIADQQRYNAWFTKENVQRALLSIATYLQKDKLKAWTVPYSFCTAPKKIGIIMAGNVPLVGFHDLLSVVISGNHAVCKMSSNDSTLLPALIELLHLPKDAVRISFVEGIIGSIDAIIATGSNNSSLYFEQYFGRYPHIFRKNRTSLAVLDGTETKEQLLGLGDDIFYYFGLGCRNVSHLLLPKNYDFSTFFEAISVHQNVIYHHKYANNYDYNTAIYILNQQHFLDNGFVMLRETEELHSPLAVIHYHHYQQQDEVEQYLCLHEDSIQVRVGHGGIAFGQTQYPQLTDYADNINTLTWLESLS